MRTLLSLILALFLFQSFLVAQNTAGEEYQLATKAYEAKDYPAFLTHLENANDLRPNHRTILYNLAIAYTLNHEHQKALDILKYRASFYSINDFSEDEELSPLKDFPEYSTLLSNIEKVNTPIQTSELHFEFERKGFHPEGIAIHPQSGNFYLSDVRCGEIYSLSKDGSNPELVIDLKELGFWGGMGMAFDKTDANILWVTTSALPQFCEYTGSLEGKSAMLKIDLQNKKLIRSYSLEGNHVFGDLITSKEGTVYVSDSNNPLIYKIDKTSDQLELFLDPKNLFNLQGLALADENTLYVSDYITGVYSVDIATKEINPVLSENQLTRGTDGLYLYNDQLFLLQNGTRPFQIAKIDLSDSSLEIIDRAVPELNEPTLGTIQNGILYFIANSPWAFYDENGQPKLDEWPRLQIRKFELDK
ncbi:MAG: hypothetical protein ABJK11_02115 [Balneola sp.]